MMHGLEPVKKLVARLLHAWISFSSARNKTGQGKANPPKKCWPARADFAQHLDWRPKTRKSSKIIKYHTLCYTLLVAYAFSAGLSIKPIGRRAPAESIPTGVHRKVCCNSINLSCIVNDCQCCFLSESSTL